MLEEAVRDLFLENWALLGGLSLEEGRDLSASRGHTDTKFPDLIHLVCSTACKSVCSIAGQQRGGLTARAKSGFGTRWEESDMPS